MATAGASSVPPPEAPQFDISDPSDWIGTSLPGLAAVEQALRCHVCKDFYNSPMLTSCNHTFCSLCVRRSLGADGKCPLCRKPDQEMKLRGNWALREAVDAFLKSRAAVLQVARLHAKKPGLTPSSASTPDPQSPKRKAADTETLEKPESKRSRRETRASKAKAVERTAAMMLDEPEDELEDDRPPAAGGTADESEPDDGLVACPICNTRMKLAAVDRHLDKSCPGMRQSPPQARPKPPSPGTRQQLQTHARAPPERLSAPNYSLLKDNQLRKRLTELGLPTWGRRIQFEARHKEWVTIWNANCDSARPKNRLELLRDLDAWERAINQGPGSSAASSMNRFAVGGASAVHIKNKEFDGGAWAAQHGDAFRELVASARRSRAPALPEAEQRQHRSASSGSERSSAAGHGDEVEGTRNAAGLTTRSPSTAERMRREIERREGPPEPGQTTSAGPVLSAADQDLNSMIIPESPPISTCGGASGSVML